MEIKGKVHYLARNRKSGSFNFSKGERLMQTIEEYKEYTKQLEGEVGKWHNAYDALMVERNQMAKTLCENKKIIETMATELDELRKLEVECDLSKARIKELEEQQRRINK